MANWKAIGAAAALLAVGIGGVAATRSPPPLPTHPVFAASGGTRSPILPVSWTVPSWFIDNANSTGCASDLNSCTSATCGASNVGPCLTYQEIAARWGTYSPRLQQNTVLTFMSDDTCSDPVYFTPYLENNAIVQVVGGFHVLESGFLAGVIQRDRTTGQLYQATFGGASAPGLFMIDSTTGARAWLYIPAGGANTFDLTQPFNLWPNAVALPLEQTIANGDAYTLNRPFAVCAVDLESTTTSNNNTLLFGYQILVNRAAGGPATEQLKLRNAQLVESYLGRRANISLGPFNGQTQGNDLFTESVDTDCFNCTITIAGGALFGGTSLLKDTRLDGDIIASSAFGNVFLGMGQVYIGALLSVSEKGQVSASTYGASLWGPGTYNVDGGFLRYGLGGASAVSQFLQLGGLTVLGSHAACSLDHAGPATTNCGIALTPANIDGPFAGMAFIPGAVITNETY